MTGRRLDLNFDPPKVSVNCPRMVNYQRPPLTNAHITQEFVSSVIAGEASADVSLLAFRDPSSFRAGELHRHMDQ